MELTAHTMLFLSLGWCLVEDMAFALAFTPLAKAAAFPLALALPWARPSISPGPLAAAAERGSQKWGTKVEETRPSSPYRAAGGRGQLDC